MIYILGKKVLPKGGLGYEDSLNDLAFGIDWAAKSNQVWKWLRCLEKRNERNKNRFNTEGTECQEALYLLIYDATSIFYDSGIEKNYGGITKYHNILKLSGQGASGVFLLCSLTTHAMWNC